MHFEELVDQSTFAQILSFDDYDQDHEFSRELYLQFLQQAEETFNEMDKSL